MGEYHTINWPKQVLVVRSDSVHFSFNSHLRDYSSVSLWGFKIDMVPVFIPEYSEPWSLQLEKLAVLALSRNFEEFTLSFAKQIDQEQQNWIQSPLLSSGIIRKEELQPQKLKEYDFLYNIVHHPENSILINLLKRSDQKASSLHPEGNKRAILFF